MGDIAERTPLDQATADRLSAGFHRCFEVFEADDGLFAPDALFDLMPPLWRFQVEGPEAFVTQLRSIAEGPVKVDVLQTIPTATGFVTEHVETQQTPEGEVTAGGCTCAPWTAGASPPPRPTATAAGTRPCAPARPPRRRWSDRDPPAPFPVGADAPRRPDPPRPAPPWRWGRSRRSAHACPGGAGSGRPAGWWPARVTSRGDGSPAATHRPGLGRPGPPGRRDLDARPARSPGR